jgi:exosortase A-associated hydrolase 2
LSGKVVISFIGEPGSRIAVLSRRPDARAGGCVLLVPPFGEEMNKTRKMYTDVARELAERGVATVLPDLHGTGDSEGEFRDARWERWIEDIAATCAWTASQGWPVRAMLAARLGCALAAQALRAKDITVQTSVFWQPVAEGSRFLTQFLRLRMAASMMDPGAKESASELRKRLRNGETLEVAGYELSTHLADDLDAVKLVAHLDARLGTLHWMEVVSDPQAPMPGEAERNIGQARAAGIEPKVRLVAGEPFWASVEIVRIAELTRESVSALSAVA